MDRMTNHMTIGYVIDLLWWRLKGDEFEAVLEFAASEFGIVILQDKRGWFVQEDIVQEGHS